MKVRLIPSKECPPLAVFSFQFHEGSINTIYQEMEHLVYHHFNSMKVRLIPVIIIQDIACK